MPPCLACAAPPRTSRAGPAAARARASSTWTSAASGCPRSEAQRVRDLVIPPAWEDVWITPYENGHLQAVGTDDAGRRQYLYHPQWRERRDAEKFDRMLLFGKALEQGARAGAARPRAGGDAARACVRGRGAAARPRLLPDRQRRLRRRERQLRADHAGAPARAPAPARAGVRLRRQVRRRARDHASTTPWSSTRSRSCAGVAAATTTGCCPTRTAGRWRSPAPGPGQRLRARPRRAWSRRPRTSAPGTRPCWRRPPWPRRRSRARPRPPRSARSRER